MIDTYNVEEWKAKLARRVEDGMAYLLRDPGKLDNIDLDKLDLGDCLNCALAQYCQKSFWAARRTCGSSQHGMSAQEEVDLGFDLDYSLREDLGMWAILTDLWKQAILTHRANAKR